jgi:hypothetical protein
MVSTEDFRRMALGMTDAIEGAHMGHPDFRVNGRIFATLHPDHLFGMVKLTPAQQSKLVLENPSTFVPENGAWGRSGCTGVRLDSADEDTLGEAMTLAWQNLASKPAAPRRKPAARRLKPTAARSKTKRTARRARPSRRR